MTRARVHGFTLVELLVVIAIIAVLMAMALPAVQSAREVGRRTTCTNNLMQLMLGLQNYESSYESLPPGVTNPTGPIRNVPDGQHTSWIVRLLPFVDEQNVYRQVDLTSGVYSPKNALLRDLSISLLVCPARLSDAPDGSSSYAGCHHDVEAPIAADNHGVLFLNSHTRPEDVPDGYSHTLFIGEKLCPAGDLGWMSGTRATLRNTGSLSTDDAIRPPTPPSPLHVGGFGSYHAGHVVLFGFGDGAIHALTDSVSPKVLQQLGNRSDGQPLETDF